RPGRCAAKGCGGRREGGPTCGESPYALGRTEMPRCAGPRPAFSLLFGRMRSRVALAILAALGAGCASMRGVTLDRPKAAAVTPIPPAAAPPGLHTITNPRIDVSERRLRAPPARRAAAEHRPGPR